MTVKAPYSCKYSLDPESILVCHSFLKIIIMVNVGSIFRFNMHHARDASAVRTGANWRKARLVSRWSTQQDSDLSETWTELSRDRNINFIEFLS